jgi:hypothetical protein
LCRMSSGGWTTGWKRSMMASASATAIVRMLISHVILKLCGLESTEWRLQNGIEFRERLFCH